MRKEAQKKADEVFDALDDYARLEIVRCGTAFTSYEDLGDEVCAWLNARARSWYAARETRAGR